MVLCCLKESIIAYCLSFIRLVLDIVAKIYGNYVWPDQRNKIPPIRDELLLKPITELVNDIKSGKLTCQKLTQCYLDRIKEVNKYTNSVVQIHPLAMQEAEKIDKLIAETEDKSKLEKLPLLGIPFTAKDSACIKGLALTIGIVRRKNKVADRDADVVVNLRAAGALPIAVTNVPECLIWFDSHNYVTGRTNNPYDLSRIPGGSTGGCASLVGAGASILGLASDIGGSIRVPANFCGVFGHKTTSEVISSKGIYPEFNQDKMHLFSFGPLNRYASDLRVSIYSMAGKDAIDKKLPRLFEKADFRKMKIYYMLDDLDPFKTRVHHEIKSSIKKVSAHFESTYGTPVKEVFFDKFKCALSMWSSSMVKLFDRPFTSFMIDFPADNSEVNLYLEFIKHLFGKSDHTINIIFYAFFDSLQNRKSSDVQKFLKMVDEVKKEVSEMLKEDAVLFYPCHTSYAEKHGTTILKAHNCNYASIFNVLSYPVTQCPIMLSKESGMPIGFQVAAAPYLDHLTISVAEEIEKVFGGWKAPCRIE